jgi:hypothetical protein
MLADRIGWVFAIGLQPYSNGSNNASSEPLQGIRNPAYAGLYGLSASTGKFFSGRREISP